MGWLRDFRRGTPCILISVAVRDSARPYGGVGLVGNRPYQLHLGSSSPWWTLAVGRWRGLRQLPVPLCGLLRHILGSFAFHRPRMQWPRLDASELGRLCRACNNSTSPSSGGSRGQLLRGLLRSLKRLRWRLSGIHFCFLRNTSTQSVLSSPRVFMRSIRMQGKLAGHCEDPRQVASALPYGWPPGHSRSQPGPLHILFAFRGALYQSCAYTFEAWALCPAWSATVSSSPGGGIQHGVAVQWLCVWFPKVSQAAQHVIYVSVRAPARP